MAIQIPIDEGLAAELEKKLAIRDEALFDFVRDAVVEKLAREEARLPAYEAGRTVFGRHASGGGDLSVRRKQIVAEKMHAKHRD